MRQERKVFVKRAAYLAFVFVILLQSCKSVPPPNEKGCLPVKFEVIPAAPADVSGALIVTDISGSMHGFALPGSVRLFTLHDLLERAVRNAIGSAEPTPAIRRCYLGSDLDCGKQVGLRELDNASTYSAKESRLELFMLPPKQAGKSTDSQPAKDPIDPYRISLLITDGMEATAPNAGSAAPCMAGADPDCMAYLLAQRAQQGYGVWMTLLLIPFKGNHYAERPLDNSMWQRIQHHVSTLGQDPYFQGVGFSVRRAGTSIPFESYQFEGVKPIMVLALSKDIKAGRAFVQQFNDLMKRETVVQPSNAVYSIELAPHSVRERRVTKIELPKDAPIEGVRPIEGKRQQGLFDYLMECDRNATTKLNVSLEDRQGEQVVPAGVQVVYNLVPAAVGTLPDGKLTMKPTDKGVEIQMTCQQLREGKYDACLNLQAELRINLSDTAFWAALSSDNMYEAPERLFGLRDMVQKVLNFSLARPRVTDRVIFHLERK